MGFWSVIGRLYGQGGATFLWMLIPGAFAAPWAGIAWLVAQIVDKPYTEVAPIVILPGLLLTMIGYYALRRKLGDNRSEAGQMVGFSLLYFQYLSVAGLSLWWGLAGIFVHFWTFGAMWIVYVVVGGPEPAELWPLALAWTLQMAAAGVAYGVVMTRRAQRDAELWKPVEVAARLVQK